MSKRTKGPDEIFCRSCGEAIKKEAEICPECGVRNKRAPNSTSSQRSSAVGHDPSQYETTVSENWWYGILAGIVLWTIVLLTVSSVPTESTLGTLFAFLILIAWVIMPVAVYFDAQYVRANSRWNPSSAIYIILTLVWIVNLIVGAVYLYRRHEAVGRP